MTNLTAMKDAIDVDAARAFAGKSDLQLDVLVQFLRRQIVDAEWEIARQKQSIDAYQAVIDKIEETRKSSADRTRLSKLTEKRR